MGVTPAFQGFIRAAHGPVPPPRGFLADADSDPSSAPGNPQRNLTTTYVSYNMFADGIKTNLVVGCRSAARHAIGEAPSL